MSMNETTRPTTAKDHRRWAAEYMQRVKDLEARGLKASADNLRLRAAEHYDKAETLAEKERQSCDR